MILDSYRRKYRIHSIPVKLPSPRDFGKIPQVGFKTHSCREWGGKHKRAIVDRICSDIRH